MKPFVSIIVPVYNVQEYVSTCLESLIKQSYEQVEVLVVDDGSTDKSGEVCDEFAKKDERVRVFHKKNGGLSSARNYGIKKATGEYICLVDSDDYVEKGFVKEMVEAILGNNAEIAVCGYNNEVPTSRVMSGKEATLKLLIQQENMEMIAWNKMYRRDLFKDVSYPEGMNYEDTLTTYKLLSKARRVVYVAKSLYRYEERAGSITNKDKKEEKLKYREMASMEAMSYFAKQKDLRDGAEISLLTAKLAWADFAISGDVGKEHLKETVKWVKDKKKELLKNQYLSKKLKLYIYLITNLDAKMYVAFRKVRHE